MTEQQHTPEPWELATNETHAGQIAVVYGTADGYREIWSQQWLSGMNQDANAVRIVTCVNACSGLSAADLEGGVVSRAKANAATSALARLANLLSHELKTGDTEAGFYEIHEDTIRLWESIALAAIAEARP